MTSLPETLAPAARRELETRRRAYGGMVSRGEVSAEEAREDTRAWERIAYFLEHGVVHAGPRLQPWEQRPPTWAPLRDAAARAVGRREADLAARPHDAQLRQRRDAVAQIHDIFARLVNAFGAEA